MFFANSLKLVLKLLRPGVGIGDGWVNPALQFGAYITFSEKEGFCLQFREIVHIQRAHWRRDCRCSQGDVWRVFVGGYFVFGGLSSLKRN